MNKLYLDGKQLATTDMLGSGKEIVKVDYVSDEQYNRIMADFEAAYNAGDWRKALEKYDFIKEDENEGRAATPISVEWNSDANWLLINFQTPYHLYTAVFRFGGVELETKGDDVWGKINGGGKTYINLQTVDRDTRQAIYDEASMMSDLSELFKKYEFYTDRIRVDSDTSYDFNVHIVYTEAEFNVSEQKLYFYALYSRDKKLYYNRASISSTGSIGKGNETAVPIIGEAPQDGQKYVRCNGEWVAID